MLYFVMWAIFLLVVLLAIPFVLLLEKRRLRAAQPPADESDAPEDTIPNDNEPPFDQDPLSDNPADRPIDPSNDPVADPDFGGDEFAEFEEL